MWYTTYCIAEKFGEGFNWGNLAVWEKSPKLTLSPATPAGWLPVPVLQERYLYTPQIIRYPGLLSLFLSPKRKFESPI